MDADIYGGFLDIPEWMRNPEQELGYTIFSMADCAMNDCGWNEPAVRNYISNIVFGFTYAEGMRPVIGTLFGEIKTENIYDIFHSATEHIEMHDIISAVRMLMKCGDLSLLMGGLYPAFASRTGKTIMGDSELMYSDMGRMAYSRAYRIMSLSGKSGSIIECIRKLSDNFDICLDVMGMIGVWITDPEKWKERQREEDYY